jgi:outer membrane protein assembly factor BamB/plastocyanin
VRVARLTCVLALALFAAPAAAQAGAPMPGCAGASLTGGEWRTYGGDLSNTRNQHAEKVISAADVPSLTSAWVFSSVSNGGAGDFTGTPIVADGCMYIASTRGWVFAVNADTGKLVWKAKVPFGGGVNSTVGLGERKLPVAAKKKAKKKRSKHRSKRKSKAKARKKRRRARKSAAAPTAGTLYVAVTRTQKFEGCPPGDPCTGPYVVALDQATGQVVWSSAPIDTQSGADVYGSPIVYDGMVIEGVSGGAAELGDEADRLAFQGSLNFLDATTGAVIKKTWTIHAPKQPDDLFAGGAIWSTPAIDTEDKVAFVGAGNPFKPQAEHANTDAVLKFDLNRKSAKFGEVIGAYKGTIDEYVPAFSQFPCYDIPGNPPPYYPQGLGSCGDVDLDFGASPNLFRDKTGRKLVGAGQKSGVYHVFDAKTMKPVWTQITGPPTSLGGIVGSTAIDDGAVYGPDTIPGYVWSLSRADGAYRWVGPIADGAHWGPPVAMANGIVYSVDLQGFLDAFDARNGVQLAKRPLLLGGGGPFPISWGGVSIARNTVFASIGVLGLADGFVVAFRKGGADDLVTDLGETNLGGGGSPPDDGGGGGGTPASPAVVAGPGGASTGYATPAMVAFAGGSLTFLNMDIVQHDVTATDKGPDGRPLFQSKLIGLGETAPVSGVEKLKAGSYTFFCSIHPGMKGTLAVQ